MVVVVVVEIAVASVVGVYYLKSITINSDKSRYILTKCPPEPPKKLLKAFVSPEKKPPF